MDVRQLLSGDMENMREALSSCGYSFAQDVQSHMARLQLSAVALAERCGVSHTMVDKWRQGKAKPNGKERMKELGMALGMDIGEINAFLYKNGYPKLYAKNPLDSAAKLLLLSHAGREDIVQLYGELIERLGLTGFTPNANTTPLSTTALSGALYDAAQQGQVSGSLSRLLRQRTIEKLSATLKNIVSFRRNRMPLLRSRWKKRFPRSAAVQDCIM